MSNFKLNVTRAFFGVKEVNGRQMYALTLELDAHDAGQSHYFGDVQMDLLGEKMSALPSEIKFATSMFLPYKLSSKNLTLNCEEKKIGFVKTEKVSLEKVQQNLQKTMASGDPIFILKLYSGATDICQVPFRASLMLESLNTGASCMYEGPLPVIKERSVALSVVRWWLCPVLFLTACWLLLINPNVYQEHWVKPIIFDVDGIKENAPGDLLPIMPEDMLQAYDMGIIVDRVELAEEQQDKEVIQSYIEKLKKLTGRSEIAVEEVKKIRPEIEKYINHESIWQKFVGFLTFVNIIWMCSIIGITVSVGPCLYEIAGPYLERCLSAVKEAVAWIFKKILLPILEFLHNWGIFEAFGYLLCFEFIYEGSLLSIKEQTGFMIALGGLLFVLPLFWYSTALHTRKMRPKKDSKDKVINSFMVWVLVVYIPAAIYFQSTLLGYFCFSVIFTLFGFRMIFFGLGIGLGWDDDKTMEQSAASAFVIVVLYSILRMLDLSKTYLAPFSSAICVLGGNILYLAHLIMSSKYYSKDRSYDSSTFNRTYLRCNIQMMALLLVGIGFGSTFSLEGLKNTAIVYLILWVIEKYHELYFHLTKNIWVFIFTMSAAVYYIALQINKHPEFIVHMFSSDMDPPKAAEALKDAALLAQPNSAQ